MQKPLNNCKRLFELSTVYILPIRFHLINVVTTFLLLAHNRMSQSCLYNKSSISLHVGLVTRSGLLACISIEVHITYTTGTGTHALPE